MKNIDYFKLQAKNLLRDYKTRHLSKEGDIYEYDSKYFDITGIFLDYDINDDDTNFEFSLMKAQHLLATLLDFKCWNELINASDLELEIAKVKLGCFTAEDYDPSKIDEYEFFVSEAEQANNTTFDDETRLTLAKYYINGEGLESISTSEEHNSEQVDSEEIYEEVLYENKSNEPPVMLECLHCGERFLSSETKIIKLKGSSDDTTQEVCKCWPECDGAVWDLIPVDYDNSQN